MNPVTTAPQTTRLWEGQRKELPIYKDLNRKYFIVLTAVGIGLVRVTRQGHGSIYIGNRIIGAHRASYMFYRGEIGSLHVLHKCDNPKCVNPDHLFLGTNTDNVNDKVSKNRQYRPFGIKSPKAKLNPNVVAEIRTLKGVISYINVAKRFGVSPSHIHKIWRNEFWIQNHSNND